MRDKQSTNTLLLTVGGLLVLGASTFTVIANKEHASAPSQPARHAVAGAQAAVQPISYPGVTGRTALQLLRVRATVTTTDTPHATIVESINGIAGGSSGKSWQLYIDGQLMHVNVGTFMTTSGEHIEWKFE